MTVFGRAARGVRLLLAGLVIAPLVLLVLASPAAAAPATSRADAVRQLAVVRDSIDRTLELIKQGRNDEAYIQARTGYLDHYELVEVPLRLVAPELTADTETEFARIRGLIRNGAPVEEVRGRIVELRRLIDDGERQLTDVGFEAASVVAGQSFLIIFREGLEAVLLLTALLGYLETAKTPAYRKPILWGMGLALVATAVTYVALRAVLAVLPVGREVLEAVTALAAVAVLRYVSFWLVTRVENRRWQEFLRGRLFNAVSLGSTVALGRLHRAVPGGVRDGSALPGAGGVRAGSRTVGRRRPGRRTARARRRLVRDLPAGPRIARQGVPGRGGGVADGHVGGHPTAVPAAAREFLDVTAGLDPDEVRRALLRLRAAGARTVCVAEAFAPDDSANERAAAAVAAELDLPVTTSAELTGLYGLELRTVTAALNASILPVALHTARIVAAGVADAGISAR